jgi:hypothetical protein
MSITALALPNPTPVVNSLALSTDVAEELAIGVTHLALLKTSPARAPKVTSDLTIGFAKKYARRFIIILE